jgi:hypothetical protein
MAPPCSCAELPVRVDPATKMLLYVLTYSAPPFGPLSESVEEDVLHTRPVNKEAALIDEVARRRRPEVEVEVDVEVV